MSEPAQIKEMKDIAEQLRRIANALDRAFPKSKPGRKPYEDKPHGLPSNENDAKVLKEVWDAIGVPR